MKINVLFILGVLGGLISCSKYQTKISALCEKGQRDSYTIKWEVYPEQDDTLIEIYASDNDSVFPSQPIKSVNVNKFIAVIEDADSLGYSFFKLKIGNTYSDVITNRFYHFGDVQNFRDLGGYKTNDGRMVRWGKIFRSGDFSNPSAEDIEDFESLNLQTVIDLRPTLLQHAKQDKLVVPRKYDIVIGGVSTDSITAQVLENRFFRGDAILYMQDMYEAMFLYRTEEYAKLFDYLADENNYPLVFHCSLGKDQSGVAAYFLLRALGVSTDVAEQDYLLSNVGVDKSKIIQRAHEMPEVQQEAFTMLTRTDASYLRYGLACAKKEEGAIDDFMTNRLGLTKEKRKKLQDILLY